jgi:streptomycin 6-kinase
VFQLTVPEALAQSHRKFFGSSGDAWIAGLPQMAADYLERWECEPEGRPGSGTVAWVLPVRTNSGDRAILKLQPVDDETVGEPVALRAWAGKGAVRLLRDDPATGAMLLERCDPTRGLDRYEDDLAALQILSELLARLCSLPAPAELRRLSDISGNLIERAAVVLTKITDDDHRAIITDCMAAVRSVRSEPGDRLLHWDLHYQNVLASFPDSGREPWLAIDPKPLAGDPGFELLPALHNRWDDLVAGGDVERGLLRRFDLMTEVLGLDRDRAAAWTLGRVLQNMVWNAEADDDEGFGDLDPLVARTLLGRR